MTEARWETFDEVKTWSTQFGSDVINRFTVVCILRDGRFSHDVWEIINLPEPDPANFKPYNTVTDEDRVAWAKAIIGPERVAEYETRVQQRMAADKAAAGETN